MSTWREVADEERRVRLAAARADALEALERERRRLRQERAAAAKAERHASLRARKASESKKSERVA